MHSICWMLPNFMMPLISIFLWSSSSSHHVYIFVHIFFLGDEGKSKLCLLLKLCAYNLCVWQPKVQWKYLNKKVDFACGGFHLISSEGKKMPKFSFREERAKVVARYTNHASLLFLPQFNSQRWCWDKIAKKILIFFLSNRDCATVYVHFTWLCQHDEWHGK